MAYAPAGDNPDLQPGQIVNPQPGLSRLAILLQALMGGGGMMESPHSIFGGHEVSLGGGPGPVEPTHGFEGQSLPPRGLGLVPLPQVHGRGHGIMPVHPGQPGGFREGIGLRPRAGGISRTSAPGGFHTQGVNLSPRVQALLQQLLAAHMGSGHGPVTP